MCFKTWVGHNFKITRQLQTALLCLQLTTMIFTLHCILGFKTYWKASILLLQPSLRGPLSLPSCCPYNDRTSFPNIERELPRPVINLCLPPWALCPCREVSHMVTHTPVHAHYLIHFPTTLFLPGKVTQCTTCGAWKKMSKIVDLVYSWVHPLHVFLSCPETASPIGGGISSLLGLSRKDRAGAAIRKGAKVMLTKTIQSYRTFSVPLLFARSGCVLGFYWWSSMGKV